jgi:phosphate transport system protein
MEISIDSLKQNIVKMGMLAEKAIQLAFDKSAKSSQLYEIEDQINSFHRVNDDLCLKYLALKHPMGPDLRFAIACVKINGDLERIGDQAINIKRALTMVQEAKFPQIHTMKEEVGRMLKECLDSFIHRDTKMATSVIHNDQVVNELQRSVIKMFLKKGQKEEIELEEGFQVTKIAKCLERIGDLATNISEDVIFIVSGSDIRHNPEIKKTSQIDEKLRLIQQLPSDQNQKIDMENITKFLKKTTEN